MNLPLVDHFAIFQIHAVDRMRVLLILQNHVCVFCVKHNLLWAEELPSWGLDFRYVRGKLKVVSWCVLEYANLRAPNDEGPVMLVSDS